MLLSRSETHTIIVSGCTALQKGTAPTFVIAFPDDTNQNGNAHRNDNPDNRNSSG